MKKSKREISRSWIGMLLCSTMLLTACSENDGNGATTEEKDATDAVQSSLARESGGMTEDLDDAATYADENTAFTADPAIECGVPYTNAYAKSLTGVSDYSYDYSASRTLLLSCATSSLDYDASYSGTYETPRMSSDDAATADWTIAKPDAQSAVLVFNGSFTREGMQKSKVRQQRSFNSTLVYSLSDLKYDTESHRVISGNASVTFNGVGSDGNEVNYTGTLTFNGDGTATLQWNGHTYILSI